MEPLPRNLELESAAFSNPDDHDRWRVYADWLLAQGDSRGELIMLWLHEHGAFLSERLAFEQTRTAREAQMVAEWQSWAEVRELGTVEFRFARGLLDAVKGSLVSLAPHLDWLFEQAPIRTLVLRHCKPADVIEVFGNRPAWAGRLAYLKFEASPKLDATSITALAGNPALQLDGLNLTGCGLDGPCCAALTGLATTQLRRLVLTANAIDDAALATLLTAGHRSQWHKLYLTGNPITQEGVAMLARAPGLEALRELYMRDVGAEYAAFMPLADPAALPGLRVLQITTGWNADRPTKKALKTRFGTGLRGAGG